MLLRFDAYLNGESFAFLDPSIILRDIVEFPPQENRNLTSRAYHGMRSGKSVRRSLSVKLVFVVREYDVISRSRVMQKIATWVGNGGWLTISSRPDQRLYVVADALPALGSSLKWTADIELTLTAYERPYWEQQWPASVTVNTDGVLTPIGTHPEAYVECDVINNGDVSMTELTLSCADTSIRLNNLSVAPGDHVTISYTDDDILQIMASGVSALANRTAESDDDLIAMAGKKNAVSVEAAVPVTAVFRARGRFL